MEKKIVPIVNQLVQQEPTPLPERAACHCDSAGDSVRHPPERASLQGSGERKEPRGSGEAEALLF